MRRSALFAVCIALSACQCGQKALVEQGPHAEVTPIPDTSGAATLAFGPVGVGSTKTLDVTVLDDGTEPLQATPSLAASTSAELTVDFTSGTQLTEAPGATFTFAVTFAPVVLGAAQGSITLVTNSNSTPHDFTISITGTGTSAPNLCIAAADLDFGDVQINSTKTQTVHLQSCGTETLNLSAISPGGPEFALANTPPTLPAALMPGDTLAVDISFTPTAAGPVSRMLSISSDDPSPGAFDLTGNGTNCVLDVQPGTLAFGSVVQGLTASQTLQLISIGESDCTVSAITAPAASSGFTLNMPPAAPLDLPPGLEVDVEVDFTPSSAAAASGQVTIASDDGAHPSQVVNLTGTGTAPPPCAFTANPNPVNFGSVGVGQSSSQNVVITNHGTSDCYVNSSALNGDTSFSAMLPGSLPPTTVSANGGTLSVPVKFTPADATTHSGTMVIKYSDQEVTLSGMSTLSVPLSGGALAPKLCLTPTSLDFGSVAAHQTAQKSFAIQSCGPGPLQVRGVIFSAGTSHDFTFPTPPAVPLTLAPNAVSTVNVDFIPSTTSGSAGTVQVLSNDPAQPVATVQLKGNLGSCSAALLCTPASLDFTGTTVGQTSARPVNCVNSGSAALTVSGVAISSGSDPDLSLLAGRLPAVVQPGGVLRAQVQFAPNSTNAGTATFTLQTGGCGDGEVNVTAQGLAAHYPMCPAIAAFTPQIKWQWNGSPSASDSTNLVMTPAVVNLTDDNGDGQIDENDVPDVVFASCSTAGCCVDCADVMNFQNSDLSGTATLHAVSGKDGSEEWTLTDPSLQVPAGAQLAIADLDGDGVPEIIAVQHSFRPGVDCPGLSVDLPMCGKYVTGVLLVLDNKGHLKFQTEPYTQPIDVTSNDSAPLVADLDQDGSPEIIYGDTVFDSSGHVLWHMSKTIGDNGQGVTPIAADVDGDGFLELIGGPTAYHADGGVLWSTSGIADGMALIADVDGDGKPEVIERPDALDVIVLDGLTGAVKKKITFPAGADAGVADSVCPGAPTAADFLGNGSMQIGVPSGNWFYLVRGDTGEIVWQHPTEDYVDQCGASGAAAFSFFGDGKTDVVYADSENIYVWRGDGTQVYKADRESSTLFETPVVADVDNDGHADIVITNQGIGGTSNGLTVLSDSSNNWPATRRIWGQWNYHVTDYNENGTIPRVEQAPWLKTKLWRGNPAECVPQ